MSHSIEGLMEITATLRSPNGCPWDKLQDHQSIKNYFIEEVYEVIEAIDNNNMDELKEELGDVLFQIVFHCQMASEAGLFDMNDVIRDISDKMVRRHPHVFEHPPTDDVDMVLEQWEDIKKNEPNQKKRSSQLDGIPPHLPVLHKTLKTIRKAAKTDHYTVPSTEASLANIHDLLNNLTSADQDKKEALMAEVLFKCVEISSQEDIQPEAALRERLNAFACEYREQEKK